MALGRVLVVDDDQDIRDALSAVLEDEGFLVQSAADGRQALNWLQSNVDDVGVILLDLMMPGMDGWAFLRAKEGRPAIASVPVVVITAGHDCPRLLRTHNVRQCLRKPLDHHRLLKVISDCQATQERR